MVDGKNHEWVEEKLSLTELKLLPEVKTATVADVSGRVSPGVKMQRTVSVTSDYALDVFQVASEEERVYDWLFHTYGEPSSTTVECDMKPAEFPDSPPWTWLKNPKTMQSEGDWQAEWDQDDVRVRLTLFNPEPTEIILCDYPSNDRFDPPSTPMVIARRKCRSTLFAAVYQAERGELQPLDVILSEGFRETIRVTIKLGGSEYEHLIPEVSGVL